MHVPERLRDLAVSDSGFVFDPHVGATFSVNPTGLVILRALIEGEARDEILTTLTQRFETDGRDLGRDLDEFVLLMRQQGLVPEEFSL